MEEFVGLREFAAMLGQPAKKVATWRVRGKLPEPAQVLAMGPIWRRADAEAWIAAHPELRGGG